MGRNTLYTLAVLLAGILTVPANAGGWYWGHGRSYEVVPYIGVSTSTVTTHVDTVTHLDAQDESVIYQQWFNAQVHDYDDIDSASGERLSELTEMVNSIENGHVTVSNAQGFQQTVNMTDRTVVTFDPCRAFRAHMGSRMSRYPAPGVIPNSRLENGDLVVLEGVMKGSGLFLATRVRVVGHVWSLDDDAVAPTRGYTLRSWGEVAAVDTDRQRIEVRSNTGYRVLHLAAGGELLANGHTTTLDFLHRGDHVVFYAARDEGSPVEIFRVVWLSERDAYPTGDVAYWSDPADAVVSSGTAVVPTTTSVTTTTYTEGDVESVYVGTYFTRLMVRSGGALIAINVGNSGFCYGPHGEHIALHDLHGHDHIRVQTYKAGGVNFGGRVEKR